jgi:hypothetical protein
MYDNRRKNLRNSTVMVVPLEFALKCCFGLSIRLSSIRHAYLTGTRDIMLENLIKF